MERLVCLGNGLTDPGTLVEHTSARGLIIDGHESGQSSLDWFDGKVPHVDRFLSVATCNARKGMGISD